MRLTAVLIGLAWLAPTAAPAADVFSGQVLADHTGTPLVGAEVRISRDGVRELVANFDTDGQGHFTTSDLPVGEYRVEIRKQGYAAAALRYKGGDAPLLVRLVRYGIISGRVTDSRGQAVAGASLSLLARDSGGGFRRLDGRNDFSIGGVDERGQYRIFNIPPGQYEVAVRYNRDGADLHLFPDDRRPRVFEVAGGEEYGAVDFVYTPRQLYTVNGKVEPADKLYAIALTPVDRPEFAVAVVTRTGRDGAFKLSGVPAGSYTLFASGPALSYMQSQARLDDNPVFGKTGVEVSQNVEPAVRVAPAPPVTFLLRAMGKACAQTAQFKLTPVEDWGMLIERTIDVVLGREQTVKDLAPARYRMAFTRLDEGCYGVTERVDLSAPLEKPVPVEIAPAGSIRARLTGSGAGPGATVVLVPEGKEAVRMTLSDAKGQCAFEELKPGHYRMAAWPAGTAAALRWVHDLLHMFEIDVAGGVPLEIDLPVSRAEKLP